MKGVEKQEGKGKSYVGEENKLRVRMCLKQESQKYECERKQIESLREENKNMSIVVRSENKGIRRGTSSEKKMYKNL